MSSTARPIQRGTRKTRKRWAEIVSKNQSIATHSKDLLPETGVTRGEERVLAGVPAEEVRRVDVARVGFAAGPDFVEHETGWGFRGAVQVVGEAAVFFACGAYQGAELGFEEHFLAVARAQLHDQCHGFFRELGVFSLPRFARTGWLLLRFALRHNGRDSTPTRLENPNRLIRDS